MAGLRSGGRPGGGEGLQGGAVLGGLPGWEAPGEREAPGVGFPLGSRGRRGAPGPPALCRGWGPARLV